MTLAEIEQINKEMLLASDIADYLGVDPQSIREQAEEDPRMLGFPVIRVKTRTMIPKEGFLNYCKGVRYETL